MPRIELPKRFPLYGPLTTRSGDVPLLKDCRLINGFAELDPSDKEYWIYKRPGLSPNSSLSWPVGSGLGIYQSPSIASLFSLFTVTGSTLRMGPATVSTGLEVRGNQPFIFESVSSTPVTVIMVSPFKQYLITTSPVASVQDITGNIPAVAPLNLPTLVPGVAYLDSTVYVMDTKGNIFGSALNDATTWDPLNVIAANATSDQGTALAKQLNYIIAFKQTGAFPFYNNSNPAPGSPLSPVPDAMIPLGCFAPYSVKTIDNSILWLSSNETVSPQLVQMDNLVPKIVSTPSVERLLDSAIVDSEFGGDGVTAWVLKHGGHRFYGLNLINLNLTLIYDIDQQAWYIWTTPTGSMWNVVGTSYRGAIGVGITGPHLAQAVDGTIYDIDSATIFPNDAGKLFPVDIYTPNFDGGVDRIKVLNLLHFSSDQTPGSILNIRYNDNDYAADKWSNFRNINLSHERPFIDNEGSFYRRAYHLRHMCNTALRIKSSDLSLGLGSR